MADEGVGKWQLLCDLIPVKIEKAGLFLQVQQFKIYNYTFSSLYASCKKW